MDFAPTEAQEDLSRLTRSILADRATNERLREIESGDDRFDRDLWAALAKSDVLSAALPESVDGGGFGLLEQCGVLIEVGRAVAPVPYLMSVVVAASALARFGDQRQRERWAKPAATGDLVLTAALNEEGAADRSTPATTAERVDGGWMLNGAKTSVPSGPVADCFLIPALTPTGPAVFLVEPSDPGTSVERQHVVDSDSEARIELVDVRLNDDRLLGEVATGQRTLDWLIDRTTIGLCAEQLGITERALELTSEYARERTQFDRPIGSFQAVAQRMADAFVDVEAVRLTMWQAAWRAFEGLPCGTEVATAKFWASEAGHRVAHTAVHVHGGVGLDMEHRLHRYFVAAKRREFALGAATAQLRRIGSALAADAELG